MLVTPKVLISSQQLADSNATLFAASLSRHIIDKMTLTNTTASAVIVTIDLVDSGGAAGASERVISARSISPGETYRCPEVVGHYLNPGDTIQGLASSASAITIRCSGREVSGV